MSRRRGYRKRLIASLRDHVKHASPYGLTFSPCGSMTEKERATLEQHLEERFTTWVQIWIMPLVDAIEHAWIKPKEPA